jgi:hypothetical protein
MKSMRSTLLSVILWTAAMASVSCSQKSDELEQEKKIEIQELPADFVLPGKIWDLIAPRGGTVTPGHGTNGPAADGKVPDVGTKTMPIIFAPVQVMLVEKNPGVLRWPKVVIQFPLGGGKLDFSNYLTGVVGTFYVQFINAFTAEDKETLEPEVFFWSRAKKRVIDREIIGSGCNKILELSLSKLKVEDKLGIKVNTKDARYLSVLAGHYFFVKRTPKQIFVSQIEMTNSDLQQHLCEPAQLNKKPSQGGSHDSRPEHE